MKKIARGPAGRCRRAGKMLCMAGLGVLVCLGCAGCHSPGAARVVPAGESANAWEAVPAQDCMDAIAREYVRVALALGERDPDSLDYSVASPELATAIHNAYPAYDEILTEVARLKERLGRLPAPVSVAAQEDSRSLRDDKQKRDDKQEAARVEFLTLQLTAIESRIAMLRGVVFPFDAEANALFATTRLPETAVQVSRRRASRARILAQLPSARGKATDAERYGQFDQRYLIPADRLDPVMTAALAACRTRTLEHLKLPAGESVELTFVHNKPWSAFSRYRGHAHSTISLNLDFPISVDEALELACHEGYPGHHVFNSLRDAALAQGKGWPEMQVQLTFTPQSYLSEAAAAYAPRMAFSPSERVRVEREMLFPLAGLPAKDADKYVAISTLVRELDSAEPGIAREYLDGRLEFVRAGNALEAELLMAHPDASLLYLNEFRSYMLAYTDGPRRIAAALPGAAGTLQEQQARWVAYEDLMVRLGPALPSP